jgi:type II secretory pathway component GspD/PulD (secretin)
VCNDAAVVPRLRTGPLGAIFVIAALSSGSPAIAQSALGPRDLPVTRLEVLTGPKPATVPVTRLSDASDLDGPRTLSLTFPKPAPVGDVLLLLVRGTRISVVLDGSVAGTFTGELRGLTLRQALEAVLFSANLDYDMLGTVIRVFPRRPRTRLFDLDLVAIRRVSTTRVGSDMTSTGASDPFSELDGGIRALLSRQGSHHVDRRAGLVTVTDFADRLDQIGLYLETAQLRSLRQVSIDARVLRVVLNEDVPGVDLAALSARGTGGVRQTAADAPGLVITDFRVFQQALGQWGEVVSAGAPRVLATNNEPAVVRVATGSHAAVENGGADELRLAVTPQISADGMVQLSVASSYTGSAAAADSTARGDADTVARVRTGETVVLSGFQHTPSPAGSRRMEVIVLLTPTIVSSGAAPAGR